jgi:apolipoprotein N-acyltransferase
LLRIDGPGAVFFDDVEVRMAKAIPPRVAEVAAHPVICYDSWFPEVARVLALKGAEIIFCPNSGYHEACQAARACDNGVYFVPASHNRVNIIRDPSFRKLAEGGRELIMTKVELVEPKPYHYRQWQTCGMPQAYRQMPHTISDRCLEEMRDLYRTVPSPK